MSKAKIIFICLVISAAVIAGLSAVNGGYIGNKITDPALRERLSGIWYPVEGDYKGFSHVYFEGERLDLRKDDGASVPHSYYVDGYYINIYFYGEIFRGELRERVSFGLNTDGVLEIDNIFFTRTRQS